MAMLKKKNELADLTVHIGKCMTTFLERKDQQQRHTPLFLR